MSFPGLPFGRRRHEKPATPAPGPPSPQAPEPPKTSPQMPAERLTPPPRYDPMPGYPGFLPPGWTPSPPRIPPPVLIQPEPRRRELFTADFWERALTQMLHGAIAGAVGPLAAHQANLFVGSLPWYATLMSAGVGALISLSASLSSIALPSRAPASVFREAPEEREAIEAVREQFRNPPSN